MDPAARHEGALAFYPLSVAHVWLNIIKPTEQHSVPCTCSSLCVGLCEGLFADSTLRRLGATAAEEQQNKSEVRRAEGYLRLAAGIEFSLEVQVRFRGPLRTW